MGSFFNFFNRQQASGSTSLPPPDGVTQINESVFELYHPPIGVPTKVEVIFFHGLQLSDYTQAYWKTWRSRDGKVIWPQEWLGPALKNARITSISYDSSAVKTKTTGTMAMYLIIENLMQDIVYSGRFNLNDNSKVILVGHSLGGLIIKQLLLKISEEAGNLNETDVQGKQLRAFLKSCCGIFYYSTPHLGSGLASWAEFAKKAGVANVNMPIVEFLKVLNADTARINSKFSNFRHQKLTAKTRGVGELLETRLAAGFTAQVVEEASARHDLDFGYYTVRADHFDVCKPENNTTSTVFTFLFEMINILVPELQLTPIELAEEQLQ